MLASDPQPFPWREAMAIGFGVLKLSSREFWSLTPRELAAAIEGLAGRASAPMDRAAFEDLTRRFPDHQPSPGITASFDESRG
ncbi:phage tail assembly chaperone [Kaistia sp. K-TC2]|uniref:Phage tail assembly chaperone n=1 Tax=Kaistia nematophila TaxID=2994654 RepID=A0A9X3E3H4_9HYPH|nr:rcc01693 family protein [Kaistia nematophila]MCX5570428.1 phage tail assembly chaperone [Kaistia nematophila]